ncbi:cytochrome P450 71D9-like [Tripterygium wilfordii]|uniref:cytochrome P450 71D9-like n=1 Tax=Tripterygium wilfordii TaxID=458696 RepID=UPI0018F83A91|nr:cytochrome P450 71D9-like [Tripterygium wilfordii]
MENQIPFPIILSSLVFLLVLLRIWNKSENHKSNSVVAPPSPWKLPLIGNMHQMVGSLPHHRLRDLANKYGPLMHLQLGELSTIVISSPEVAKQVMKAHDIAFSSRPAVSAGEIVLYNFKDLVFAPYGDYWRQMRKICTIELLSGKRVQAMQSIREEEVSEFIKSISSKARSKINLSDSLICLTYAITTKAAIGESCEMHGAFVPLVREIIEVFGGFNLADMFPSIKLFHMISGMRTRLQKLHHEVDKILENLINEHKVKKTKIDSSEEVADNFVDVLLNLQEHGGFQFPLTSDNIKAVVLDIFTGGSETSSTTIEWAMSELIKTPRIMAKAQSEVRRVFDKQGYVDEAGLEELEFLKLVIKETLRLHPPLPLLLPRECREGCQILGYDIPVKAQIIVNAWAIGRDPDYWIDAEKFYPERFVNSSIDYKGNNFEFIPFGTGRRMCPGISFGITIVELTLAKLLYHFDWKLPINIKGEELDMTESFAASVGRKNDLYVIPIPYHATIAYYARKIPLSADKAAPAKIIMAFIAILRLEEFVNETIPTIGRARELPPTVRLVHLAATKIKEYVKCEVMTEMEVAARDGTGGSSLYVPVGEQRKKCRKKRVKRK